MITLPNNFISGLISTMGGVFTDLMPLILLVCGVLLGLYVLGELLGMLNKNKE
jgi:hypothetical protein